MKYRISALTVSVALVLAACGGGADPTTTVPEVAPTTTTAAPVTVVTTTVAPTTTAPVLVASDYGVVGVGPQEHLNVRAAAGITNERVGQLEYDTRGVARIGPEQTVDGADWWQVTADGLTGWVHSGFLDLLGVPVNATDAYLLNLGTPTVATASELAQALVASIETNSADSEGTLEVSVAGILDGEPSIAVIEVVGFADDSVGGEHLVVTMEPDDSAGWVITSIMSSPRCLRGVTTSGICT
ncbi:MAG: SH3 domain-containing protein [Acidimicrobiia bacterium]|nr:SH3 domain-containing protein [Acidimicrobiia bacterium]